MLTTKKLVLVLLCISSYNQCADSLDELYSTEFLKNYSAVRQILIKEGFVKVSFKTEDGLTLRGLFLKRPNARYNVIVCAGWYPGKKENMAPFYALLPKDCNILFFDARGHGESEGAFLWKVWRYGIDEPKDILGAISYLNKNNSQPIFVVGLCAGAFNAAHAIIHLKKHNKLEQSRIKGLFFDSGWGSVTRIAYDCASANIKKLTIKAISFLYNTKNNIDETALYQLCHSIAHYGFSIGHYIATKVLVAPYEHYTNLFDKIDKITIPMLFIHSYDDNHADVQDAIQLSEYALNKECWWIEKSLHVKHHLLHTEIYKEKLVAFINKCLE